MFVNGQPMPRQPVEVGGSANQHGYSISTIMSDDHEHSVTSQAWSCSLLVFVIAISGSRTYVSSSTPICDYRWIITIQIKTSTGKHIVPTAQGVVKLSMSLTLSTGRSLIKASVMRVSPLTPVDFLNQELLDLKKFVTVTLLIANQSSILYTTVPPTKPVRSLLKFELLNMT